LDIASVLIDLYVDFWALFHMLLKDFDLIHSQNSAGKFGAFVNQLTIRRVGVRHALLEN
jgi:hypothetical protein